MKRELLISTLAVLALAFLVVYILFSFNWALYCAVALLFLSLFDNPLATLIARSWLGFSRLIGAINSTVILTLTFYLFIFPIAVLYRVFNKKRVHYFTKRSTNSYFVDEQRSYTKESFERPF
ncbi:hypothetical protein KAH37_06890 [bacterium]|nr:hypothetical protein [bacterium]